MVDLSDEAHEERMRTAGWDPKPLRCHSHSTEYPINRLPGIIGQAVREVADSMQAPVALVAASALSAVSAVVQTQHSVSRDDRLHGPASLFFLTVAGSGERKSSVDAMFTRPIRDWEAQQRLEVKQREEEYQKVWEAWQKLEDDKGDPPEKPGPTPKILRGDDTSEALLMHLTTYPIAAVICAEAGMIFGSHAMKPEQVQRSMGQANVLWDGGPILEGRIGRGDTMVESVRVTMGLMVQPSVMKKFLSQNDGMARGIGFLARFLFSDPETTQGTRFYRDPKPMPGLDEFHQRLTALLQQTAVTDMLGRLITTHVKFNDDAQSVWMHFYNEVEEYSAGDSIYSDIRDVASKAAENAARLACCLHVFTMPDIKLIDRVTMAHACALMRWYLNEAMRFGQAAEITEELRHAELLEGWLMERHKQARRDKTEWNMTVNMIRKLGPNAIRGADKRVDGTLQLLMDHGRIRVISPNGTKSKYIVIAPQVIAEYS